MKSLFTQRSLCLALGSILLLPALARFLINPEKIRNKKKSFMEH